MCDNPYRNFPRQKIRQSLMELDSIEKDPMSSSPLVDYVNFRLKQAMEIDGEMSEMRR